MGRGMERKRETEKGIKEYIQASGMGLSKKEEQDFKALVLQNEEAARKVFRDSNHVGKGYILIFLNSEGKGTDIAKEEAAAWAYQMEFMQQQCCRRAGVPVLAFRRNRRNAGNNACE